MKEIIFYHAHICPKCVRVRKIIKEIQAEYPDINIKTVSALRKVIMRNIYTLPAIEIQNSFLYGRKITKASILSELGISPQ
ncbi:MAG: glutaredoxin family protein [Candidatus Hodarchaeota archaeon]